MNNSMNDLAQAMAEAQDAGGVPETLGSAVEESLHPPETPVIAEDAPSDAGGPPDYLIEAIEQSLEHQPQPLSPEAEVGQALDGGGCSPDLISAVEGMDDG